MIFGARIKFWGRGFMMGMGKAGRMDGSVITAPGTGALRKLGGWLDMP